MTITLAMSTRRLDSSYDRETAPVKQHGTVVSPVSWRKPIDSIISELGNDILPGEQNSVQTAQTLLLKLCIEPWSGGTIRTFYHSKKITDIKNIYDSIQYTEINPWAHIIKLISEAKTTNTDLEASCRVGALVDCCRERSGRLQQELKVTLKQKKEALDQAEIDYSAAKIQVSDLRYTFSPAHTVFTLLYAASHKLNELVDIRESIREQLDDTGLWDLYCRWDNRTYMPGDYLEDYSGLMNSAEYLTQFVMHCKRSGNSYPDDDCLRAIDKLCDFYDDAEYKNLGDDTLFNKIGNIIAYENDITALISHTRVELNTIKSNALIAAYSLEELDGAPQGLLIQLGEQYDLGAVLDQTPDLDQLSAFSQVMMEITLDAQLALDAQLELDPYHQLRGTALESIAAEVGKIARGAETRVIFARDEVKTAAQVAQAAAAFNHLGNGAAAAPSGGAGAPSARTMGIFAARKSCRHAARDSSLLQSNRSCAV